MVVFVNSYVMLTFLNFSYCAQLIQLNLTGLNKLLRGV